MVVALAPDLERLDAREQPAVAEGQVLGNVMEETVPALLTFQRQHEGAVGVDIYAGDVVHLDGDGEAHSGLLAFRAFSGL